MSKPSNDPLGLAAQSSSNVLGPVGPVGSPGVLGVPGILHAAGLDGPQHPPAAAAPEELKVKSFIILIRHATKGTLHVVANKEGAIVEFEDMEQALNATPGVKACQNNPHFIAPVYE